MQTPFYSPFQFIDAAGANFAAGTVSGNLGSVVSGLTSPGLINSSTVGLVYTGLGVAISAPPPFSVLFGNGSLSAASGTVTNAFSTNYAVNVSGLVPASGSVVAYLNVNQVQIQSGPYQVLGPPPGHPDYVPTFVPYTSYTTTNDSLNFTVGLTPPDDYTTFEFGRATLSTGATGVAFSGSFQKAAAPRNNLHIIQVSTGSINITQQMHAGKCLQFTVSGTATLPDVTTVNGMKVEISGSSALAGTVTIQTTSSQAINGWTANSSVTNFAIGAGASVYIEAQDGAWQVTGFSPSLASSSFLGLADGGNKTGAFSALVGFLYYANNVAGTYLINAPTTGIVRGAAWGIVNIGVNTVTINWGGNNFAGDPTNSTFFPEGIVVWTWSGDVTRGWQRSL